MGNNCAGKRSLDTVNDALADRIDGLEREFCTIAGSAGNKYEERFCGSIGDSEWEVAGGNTTYSCNYNNSNYMDRWAGAGCCGSACAIVGQGIGCRRIAYRGEDHSCCLRDYACNGLNNIEYGLGVYDSSERDQNGNYAKLRSCPTFARSLDAPFCRDYIVNLCSNLNSGDPNPNWRENWLTQRTIINSYDTFPDGGHTEGENIWTSPTNPVCLFALYRNVYGINGYGCMGNAPPTVLTGIQVYPTADGLIWGREMVQDLFDTYISEGGDLGAGPSDEGDTQMNDLIWSICSTIPGICTTSLENYCSTITTDDLVRNPNLLKWCGCYMPDFEYSKYTNLYHINKQCTPQCNVAGIIPLVDQTGIETLKCKQSYCVIDDVSIELYEARVGDGQNGINFNQVCGSCGSGDNTGTCQCTLTGLNFAAVQATIPSLDISQQCGAGSVCYHESTSTTGEVTTAPIPCSSELGYVPPTTESTGQQDADRWRNTKILLLFLFVIVILIIIWILFAPRSLAEENRVYERKPTPPPQTVNIVNNNKHNPYISNTNYQTEPTSYLSNTNYQTEPASYLSNTNYQTEPTSYLSNTNYQTEPTNYLNNNINNEGEFI